MRLAVDLLWVRQSKVGGIESYIRNILDGFLELNEQFEFVLLTSIDNTETFEKYIADKRFVLCRCEVYSKNVFKRIMWQNLYLGKTIKKLGISICFEPYYCKPFFGTKHIKFITTVHDLQAIHYPEYFSKVKNIWMNISWKNAVKTSYKIVAISQFVKSDIIEHFVIKENKVAVIYNAIVTDFNDVAPLNEIKRKYNIDSQGYYFTVSSLLPHKNIKTIILAMKEIKDNHIKLPCKLVVSGVGGKLKGELQHLIKDAGLEGNVIITGYISNNERNALYKYSRAFLFPSVFEGFGMPPIEAMSFGVVVITTSESCIPEVTNNQAIYVDDPMDYHKWVLKMKENSVPAEDFNFSLYEKENVAKEYYKLFQSISEK